MKVTKAKIVKILVAEGMEQSTKFAGRICSSASTGFSVQKLWDDTFRVDYYINSMRPAQDKYAQAYEKMMLALLREGFIVTKDNAGSLKVEDGR